jgi:hypothetical protein
MLSLMGFCPCVKGRWRQSASSHAQAMVTTPAALIRRSGNSSMTPIRWTSIFPRLAISASETKSSIIFMAIRILSVDGFPERHPLRRVIVNHGGLCVRHRTKMGSLRWAKNLRFICYQHWTRFIFNSLAAGLKMVWLAYWADTPAIRYQERGGLQLNPP